MISVTHIVGGKLRGSFGAGLKGRLDHKVRVRITGRKDLATFAGILRDKGIVDLADVIAEGATSASITLPAALWQTMSPRT